MSVRGNSYLRSLEFPRKDVDPRGIPGAVNPASKADTAAATGPQSSNLSIFPWWDKEYESANDWYLSNMNFTLAATAGLTTIVPTFSFQFPGLTRGVLKQLVILVQSPTTALNLTVTLLRNGQPIPGWNAIAFLPAAAAFESIPFNGMNLRFIGNDTFTASFTNQNATAWQVGIQASGWFVTQAEIDRLQGPVRY